MAAPSGSFRVLVVSDSHLSVRAPEAVSNWAAVGRHAADFELVAHAGDLSLDGAGNHADIRDARWLLDALPVPWVAIPGNHDVGDNPGSEGAPIDQGRLDRWRELIGPDYWAVDLGDWTVVGIDAQLFGSALDAEAEQWDWLDQRLSLQPPGRPVILLSHKPLTARDAELTASPRHRFVPPPARDRLLALLQGLDCRVVLSGHVHQYRVLDIGDQRHAWAPTTWAVLPERAQATVGVKRCGALALEFESTGSVRIELVEPPGLAQLTLADDVPDPYHIVSPDPRTAP